MDWPRLSDDIDIFHDADEEIDTAAQIDIATLRAAGFVVTIDVRVYGCVEASVMRTPEATLIQWMSESRTRFFPLVRDDEWGARLHRADLAVNKVLAASTRTKARDYADLLTISREMCPLGPLMMAASGKPPHFRRCALWTTSDENAFRCRTKNMPPFAVCPSTGPPSGFGMNCLQRWTPPSIMRVRLLQTSSACSPSIAMDNSRSSSRI
ncbi:nucleotidyl transferase AbiEii/AbiGii toxin family protein [Rhizobium sp. G21]|uniref:nucleotidyl transferase AbiEii/AbiGii toxin family protein n=1 Tax=Rhizobium sp. G21 TaxID=2758439 RepID=UPI001FEE88EB|nr:nucleotidyl transferase AbiEii/AbiGii toxin family protein [Rhizobium sp. G21]